jgi:aminobenzoyl-glutamate utilization protein B
MNKFYISIFFFILLQTNVFASKDNKKNLIKNIEKNISTYNNIALKIWDYAEVGYKEEKSSKELIQILENNGFKITEGIAGIPTAFIAEYGNGGPVIGILGEYDALPGLSQSNNPTKESRVGVNSGHGCGHNLFGVASAAAAIAIKEWLKESKTEGTIRFYGCPAEEGGSGKVYMVREGLFDDVDVALHWHPSSKNNASAGSTLANKTGKIRFYGTSAHAAGAPERGRSALDGLEAMNNMLNLMREHVEEESRIHYIITKGGDAPNVVPNFAEGYYYVRNPNPEEVRKMWKRVELCAEGASIGTETTFSVEVTGGVYNILPNESLQKLVHKNLSEVGGVYYNEEEENYAEKLSLTFGEQKQDILLARTIEPYEFRKSTSGGGSTDVGDVSWVVPTVGFSTATYVSGTPGHSWQAASCTGTSIGLKGMLNAAKTLALTGYDLFNNPTIIKEATKEFNKKRGLDYNYNPLIGDRKPALDYRN